MNNFKKNIFKISNEDIISTVYSFTPACDSGVSGGAECCPINTYPQTFHCGDFPIILGSVFYSDAVGATEVVGANLWYKEQISQKSYRIDNIGVVIGINTCSWA